MVPEGDIDNLSDDEELSIELPNKEIISICSTSPEIKLETRKTKLNEISAEVEIYSSSNGENTINGSAVTCSDASKQIINDKTNDDEQLANYNTDEYDTKIPTDAEVSVGTDNVGKTNHLPEERRSPTLSNQSSEEEYSSNYEVGDDADDETTDNTHTEMVDNMKEISKEDVTECYNETKKSQEGTKTEDSTAYHKETEKSQGDRAVEHEHYYDDFSSESEEDESSIYESDSDREENYNGNQSDKGIESSLSDKSSQLEDTSSLKSRKDNKPVSSNTSPSKTASETNDRLLQNAVQENVTISNRKPARIKDSHTLQDNAVKKDTAERVHSCQSYDDPFEEDTSSIPSGNRKSVSSSKLGKNDITSVDNASTDYDDDFDSDTYDKERSSSTSHSSQEDTAGKHEISKSDDTDEDCSSLSSSMEMNDDRQESKNRQTGENVSETKQVIEKHSSKEKPTISVKNKLIKKEHTANEPENSDGDSNQCVHTSEHKTNTGKDSSLMQYDGRNRGLYKNKISLDVHGVTKHPAECENRPVSSKSERISKTMHHKTEAVNRKILHRRSDSLPNKVTHKNISVSIQKDAISKDITCKTSIEIKNNCSVQMPKAPLPSLSERPRNINRHKETNKSAHSQTRSNENYGKPDASVVSKTSAFDSKTSIREVHVEKPKTGVLVRAAGQGDNKQNLNIESNLGILPGNKGHLQTNDPKYQNCFFTENAKGKNINAFTDKLVEIQKQSRKSIDITVEDYDENEINQSNCRKSSPILPQHKVSTKETITTADITNLNDDALIISDTKGSTNSRLKNSDRIGKNHSQSAVSSHKCSPSISKKFKTESKEAASDQYSISSTSVLTSKGNDTSKSVLDKTNTNTYLMTGNELISPLASCEERKHDKNNISAIRVDGDITKDCDTEQFSSVTEESEDIMEDEDDSKSVRQKGPKKRPVNKSLYRSHTRPKHLSTNRSEHRNLKYSLDRPSSPFIFSDSKAYVRQNSVLSTSNLDLQSDDAFIGDIHDKRRSKTGLADLARLKDIRRHLRLADEVNLDSVIEKKEPLVQDSVEKWHETVDLKSTADPASAVSPEIFQATTAILHDVIARVCSSAREPRRMLQRRCTAKTVDGKEELCCILHPPLFIFNLSVVGCEFIDVLAVNPVTKTRHEVLLSHIIKIAPPESSDMYNEGGVVVFLPVTDFCIQAWQEPIVRELDDRANWVDVKGECCIVYLQDGKKTLRGVEVKVNDKATLAVIARPKLDIHEIVSSSENTVVSSLDSRIEVSVGSKPSELDRCLELQVIPVDTQILTWFSRIHGDDEDYQILSCSPLVNVHVSSHHAESLRFSLPYTSLYSRTSRQAGLPLSTSCVHSPMPRIPSPYFRRNVSEATPRPTKSSRKALSALYPETLKSEKPTSRKISTTRQVSQIQPLKGRSKAHIPSGEKHLVLLREGPGKQTKLLSLSKVTDVTADNTLSFGVYENSASVVVIETRTGLQYTSIGEVTRAFTDFISLKKVTIKVHQTLCEVQTLHIKFEDSQTNVTSLGEDAAYYNYIETEILLNEGDLIAYTFKGNIQQKRKSQTQFCYHTFCGFRTSCLIDVQNPYGQRSLPAFHGILQIFSLSEARSGPIDVIACPDFNVGWECIAEIPVTLPKAIAKLNSTVTKAPLALELEEPLTPDFIRLLCRDLRNDWERFAKELHIGRARIQSIKQQNNSTTIPEKIIMDILACWMKRQPKVNDKASPLITALRRCNKWQLASELRERQKAMTALRSETAEDMRLQKAISLACKSPSVSIKWRQLFFRLNENSPTDITEEANEIEASYIKDSACCHHALYRWKSRVDKPTVWELVDALRALRCTVAADAISSQFSKSK